MRSYQIVNLNTGSFKIDTEDFHVLVGRRWVVSSHKNSAKYIKIAWDYRGSRRESLHRLILGAKEGQMVDHINGDTLDNRRCNLRLVTPSQNMMNKKKGLTKKSTSIYKGVDFHKGKWRVRIKKDRKNCADLRCSTEIEAALEYNKLALAIHGEYAKLNVIK